MGKQCAIWIYDNVCTNARHFPYVSAFFHRPLPREHRHASPIKSDFLPGELETCNKKLADDVRRPLMVNFIPLYNVGFLYPMLSMLIFSRWCKCWYIRVFRYIWGSFHIIWEPRGGSHFGSTPFIPHYMQRLALLDSTYWIWFCLQLPIWLSCCTWSSVPNPQDFVFLGIFGLCLVVLMGRLHHQWSRWGMSLAMLWAQRSRESWWISVCCRFWDSEMITWNIRSMFHTRVLRNWTLWEGGLTMTTANDPFVQRNHGTGKGTSAFLWFSQLIFGHR